LKVIRGLIIAAMGMYALWMLNSSMMKGSILSLSAMAMAVTVPTYLSKRISRRYPYIIPFVVFNLIVIGILCSLLVLLFALFSSNRQEAILIGLLGVTFTLFYMAPICIGTTIVCMLNDSINAS